MTIFAQSGSNRFVVVGKPLSRNVGIVVEVKSEKAFAPYNLDSILARGYWGKVTADKETIQEQVLRFATFAKPIVISDEEREAFRQQREQG